MDGVGYELITNANVLVAAVVALAAGLVSFASPCVLPLVPGYLSFMTGLSGQDLQSGSRGARSRVVVGSTLFIAGFAIPFALLGYATGLLNAMLFDRAWQIGLGVVVVVCGVLLATGRLVREYRVTDRAPDRGLLSAPALGFIFGVGWIPCTGPALAAILALVGSTGSTAARGSFLALMYALGLGLPFLVVGVAFRRAAGALELLRRNGRRLQVAGGVMLTSVGVAIAAGWWNDMLVWMRSQPIFEQFTVPL